MIETVATCELSVVIPRLNEADTIGTCVAKSQRSVQEHRIAGEVIVSDNGSTDGSIEIAKKMGARATMIDLERATQSIAWGKLTLVGRPHQPATHGMKGAK